MFFRQAASNTPANSAFALIPPVGGLNSSSALMNMPKTDAVMMENFIPYPDRIQMRPGFTSHATGFVNTPYRLWAYANASAESLWATTDTGIFNVTAAGAIGAAAIALTNGKTSSSIISTGANVYMMVVNGQDSLKQYDGTTWTSVATYSGGAVATTGFSAVETYRQRLFFLLKDSLSMYYLPINAIGGTATLYDLGALFRRGGKLVALATWTIDGGIGPEDQIAFVTSKGEIAVFAGSDPADVTNWQLRGVYYVGRPLGTQCLFKYGGDLLFLCENGLYPLSQVIQSVAIDRTQTVTDKIRSLFNESAQAYFSGEGWQIVAQPDIPLLIVNIPSTPVRKQFVMHAQTGAWASFTGWNAFFFARMAGSLYFTTSTGVQKVGGMADDGTNNITSTLIQAYSRLGYPRTKQIVEVKPYFETAGNFSFSLGVISDFGLLQEATSVNQSSLNSGALWGSAIWGTAVWTGSSNISQDWNTVPDLMSTHKALYLQIVSKVGNVGYSGADLLYRPGGNF